MAQSKIAIKCYPWPELQAVQHGALVRYMSTTIMPHRFMVSYDLLLYRMPRTPCLLEIVAKMSNIRLLAFLIPIPRRDDF